MCNSVLSKICLLLAIIGGLNWGFVGIWKLDIIAWLLGGQTSWAARTVYILVAAAAICLIPALCSPSKKGSLTLQKPVYRLIHLTVHRLYFVCLIVLSCTGGRITAAAQRSL